MDATTLNTLVGIVGIIVGIIGIIVGIIGWRSLSEVTKIKNTAKANNGATVYQVGTLNQGVSEDTVRLITKDMTKEEMCKLIVHLVPVNTDNENCAANRLRAGKFTSEDFDKIINEIPTTYYGRKPPKGFPELKDGSIWWQTE